MVGVSVMTLVGAAAAMPMPAVACGGSRFVLIDRPALAGDECAALRWTREASRVGSGGGGGGDNAFAFLANACLLDCSWPF